MIARLQGMLAEVSEEGVVVDVGGVGYEVLCSQQTLGGLPAPGESLLLLTHLQVREDSWNLYGFLEPEERELFRMLISVAGVGPKVALAALGSGPPAEVAGAIANGETVSIRKMPGIGKRLAERIVVELKEKVMGLEIGLRAGAAMGMSGGGRVEGPLATELRSALQNMGFSPVEIERVARSLKEEIQAGEALEELVRKAVSVRQEMRR